jgi:RNA 2',3'-cyclic 3'-phosphodiesterase
MPRRQPDASVERFPGAAVRRLFFALWPDAAVRANLAAWGTALHGACGGRPTRSANLHLTLAFLGDTPVARGEELTRVAATVVPRRFELVLDQPGYWKHNRIAWAGASADPPALTGMVGALRGVLAEAGFRFDAKPFVSHVTLLRKAHAPGEMPVLAPIVWRGSGFALVRSVPGPDGSNYVVDGAWQVEG